MNVNRFRVSYAIPLLALGLSALACDKDNTAAPPSSAPKPVVATPPPQAPTPTAAAKPASPPPAKKDPEDCPLGVSGASGKVSNRKDGVEIVITSKDSKAEKEIRDRAHKQEQVSKSAADSNGPRCPSAPAHSAMTVKEIKGGVRILIKADKPEDVGSLQKTTKERADTLTKSHAALKTAPKSG
jgi:hypothetical protein